MVPESAETGDELCQLGDCDYLVLLRPHASETTTFEFIGAYCFWGLFEPLLIEMEWGLKSGDGFETISIR